jgi:hypothetical protein
MPFETWEALREDVVSSGLHLIAGGLNRKVADETIRIFHRLLSSEGVTDVQFEAAVRDYAKHEDTFPSPAKMLRYCQDSGHSGSGVGEAYILGTTIRARDYIRDPESYAAVLCQREADLREAAAKERAARAALVISSRKEADAKHLAQPSHADRPDRKAGEGLQHEGREADRVVLAGSELGEEDAGRDVEGTDGLDSVQPVLPEPDRKGCPF